MLKRTWGYKILVYKLRINPLAQEDLKGIKAYIEKDNSDAAIKVIKELLEKIDLLS
jgi:plasmid stabilization system protein ParE